MKNLKNWVMHFHVTVNGMNYWGNYTPETFDFYLNSDNGVLGYTDGDRVVGNWSYDEVVGLVSQASCFRPLSFRPLPGI